MGGGANYTATVEEVFNDFAGRRAALIKALTTDFESFYQQCDPERENLCLYGFPDEQWEVNIPVDEVPPDLPEPTMGINFSRDGMQQNEWLTLVAIFSDSWLVSVAFYFGARFGFDRAGRNRLFDMINELPTIVEVVTGTANKQEEKKSSNSNLGGNNSKSSAKEGKYSKGTRKNEEDDEATQSEEDSEATISEEYHVATESEEEKEQDETPCGSCGQSYNSDEFWICCDICDTWFHGVCVKITPAMAQHVKLYICPSCCSKEA